MSPELSSKDGFEATMPTGEVGVVDAVRRDASDSGRGWVVVLLLALTGTACAGGSQGRGPTATGVDQRVYRMTVENRNWSDLALYIERNGTLRRVGGIGSFETRHLRVPKGLIGGHVRYRLVAKELASGREFATPEIIADELQEVFWTVTNAPSTAQFYIRAAGGRPPIPRLR